MPAKTKGAPSIVAAPPKSELSEVHKVTDENFATEFQAFQQDLTIIKDSPSLRTKEEVRLLKSHLGRAHELMHKMRRDYMKEVNHLTGQVSRLRGVNGKANIANYVEVKFFDPTEMVDQDVRDALNTRLAHMKEKYLGALKVIEDVNAT